ncbi:hypothetical protein [Serinicoccus sediminis]|uniref:hypothetical protein n=1 Tax=Serinicoccus sediminis TaxID=2306021 RepID=UPI001022720F|nr:hypothetical protein [Serinicoccus sediminis]
MSRQSNLVTSILRDLGDPCGWPEPVEFRGSLALCTLNSVYTLRATSTSAINVLNRYRDLRACSATDSGPDLLESMKDAGGPEPFAVDVLRNESKLPGTTRLRTVGVYEALTKFSAPEIAVTTAGGLRVSSDLSAARRAWLSVTGLGKQSWSYLLMNAGVETETKVDVMLKRYVGRAARENLEDKEREVRRLVRDASTTLNVHPRRLDRAIWWHESRYGRASQGD